MCLQYDYLVAVRVRVLNGLCVLRCARCGAVRCGAVFVAARQYSIVRNFVNFTCAKDDTFTYGRAYAAEPTRNTSGTIACILLLTGLSFVATLQAIWCAVFRFLFVVTVSLWG